MEDTKTQYHVFYGDDEDYGYPYAHKYDEPDSDRGASDEGWDDYGFQSYNKTKI